MKRFKAKVKPIKAYYENVWIWFEEVNHIQPPGVEIRLLSLYWKEKVTLGPNNLIGPKMVVKATKEMACFSLS